MRAISRTLILCIGLLASGVAASIQIRPHAQWTFEMPLEQVFYRPGGVGFPIELIVSESEIIIYSRDGSILRQIERHPGDHFTMNAARKYFMLVQVNESILATEQEQINSFQVFDRLGQPLYTSVIDTDLELGELQYELTPQGSVLMYFHHRPWVLELAGEDTLLYVPDDRIEHDEHQVITRLKQAGEYLQARSRAVEADSFRTDLALYNSSGPITQVMQVDGQAQKIFPLWNTDYFFLETQQAAFHSLSLYHRDQILQTYPWKSWNIEDLRNGSVFIISEADLNVINLGDGAVGYSVHPIDLSSISDACYMTDWGLYLYLRFESFYTETGDPAYRNFQLEGLERSGQIVHKSSFGAWSYSLPKIDAVSKDLFAIQLHNAVLLYRMELKQ